MGGSRDADARERDSALLDGVVRARRGLRRPGLLAPGGAQLLEHPQHAGSRGAAGVAARPPRVRSDRPRRRAVHGEPRADRRLLRRVPRGRRRGGPARVPGRVSRGAVPRAEPPRPPRRARRGRRHLRAVVLRRHIQRGRAHRGDRAQRPAGPRAGAPHLGARPEARLLPRQAHGALGRDRPGPPGPRGHARLHAGLPLLPGGLLVPPRPRARSRRRGRHDQEIHRRVGLERGRPSLAVDRGLLADRAPGEMPGAGARRPARLDLAAVAAGRGVLGRVSPTPSRRSASPASPSRRRRARTACAASSTRRSPTRT